MLAKLNRDEFIELLGKLGDEADEVALSAARDIHARLTVADIDWDDLLVPEQSDEDPEPEGEVDLDDEYLDDEGLDDEGLDDEDLDDEDLGDEDLGDDLGGDLGEDFDDEDDADQARLDEEERKEAMTLIQSLLKKDVSADTKEELEGYREDLDEDEFEQMDLRYLRALNKRLSAGS
jgi:hypothetical protein